MSSVKPVAVEDSGQLKKGVTFSVQSPVPPRKGLPELMVPLGP